MNLDDMSRRAGDPRYIAGIYNYCDRWCERCDFTQRCLNYDTRLEFEELARESEEDQDGDGLVADLTNALQGTVDLLQTVAEEEMVEWEAGFAASVDDDIPGALRAAERHPLTQAADAYIGMVNDWFGFVSGKDRLAGSEDFFANLDLLSEDVEQHTGAIEDAVETIHWFQFFISVKIQRALYSLRSEAYQPEFLDDMPRDSDGTAKIALIAIDRSVGAWGALLSAFPDGRTLTLSILALLTRLRQDVAAEFPNAWAFVRPGFDEPDPGDDEDW